MVYPPLCSSPSIEGKPLGEAEVAEILLFRYQNRFKIENEERRQAFERDITNQRYQFQENETRRENRRVYLFAYYLSEYGIEQMRNNEVPAYSFPKFRDLPPEIQMKVWTTAARVNCHRRPQINYIVSMIKDTTYSRNLDRHYYTLGGSSRIWSQNLPTQFRNWDTPPPLPLPGLFSACKDSRLAARTIYTRLPVMKKRGVLVDQHLRHHFNTFHDVFYMGGSVWDEFKILVDLLIKLNTSRPLLPSVQHDVSSLLKIRKLMVDFNIFADVPPSLWTFFRQLRTMTIVFYPHATIKEENVEDDLFDITRATRLLIPRQGSKFGKRADWILASATSRLDEAKKAIPHWKVPEVHVVIRTTDDEEVDEGIEDKLDEYLLEQEAQRPTEDIVRANQGSHEEENQNDEDGEDGESSSDDEEDSECESDYQAAFDNFFEAESEDNETSESSDTDEEEVDEHPALDAVWYEQAAARMSSEVTKVRIKKLKHKHHRCQRRPGIAPKPVSPKDFLTDSEGEEGKAAAIKYNRRGIRYPRRPEV